MKIYKQITAIMAEVGAIEKNRGGAGIGYSFRGIDDIYFALQPLFAKHGVCCAPRVTAQHREERPTKSGGTMTFTVLTVDFTMYAEDGSSLKLTTVGEAMDTSDKSSNKAMSAAMKYAMLQLFCIPTEEEKDTEYQNHEPAKRTESAPAPVSITRTPGGLTGAQLGRLEAIQKKVGMPNAVLSNLAKGQGIVSKDLMNKAQYDSLCHLVEQWKA